MPRENIGRESRGEWFNAMQIQVGICGAQNQTVIINEKRFTVNIGHEVGHDVFDCGRL